MQCPLCGYQLSDFDSECPKCHGKGLPKPAAVPQSPPPLPYNPTIPRPAPVIERKSTSPLLIVGLLLVPVIGGFGFLKFSGMELRPKTQESIATPIPIVPLAPTAAPVVVPIETQRPEPVVTRADEAYIENMGKVFNMMPGNSEAKNLSTTAKFSVMQAEVRQAQMQMMEAPPTPRFAKAHSLMRDSLSEMSLGITMAQLGGSTKNQKFLDEARTHFDNSEAISNQSFDEFDKIVKELRGK